MPRSHKNRPNSQERKVRQKLVQWLAECKTYDRLIAVHFTDAHGKVLVSKATINRIIEKNQYPSAKTERGIELRHVLELPTTVPVPICPIHGVPHLYTCKAIKDYASTRIADLPAKVLLWQLENRTTFTWTEDATQQL